MKWTIDAGPVQVGPMRWWAIPFLAACSVERGPWEDVPITRAWLDSLDVSSVNLVAGVLEGDAVLGFETAGGDGGWVPVHLGGGSLGVAIDLAIDPEGHAGSVEVDLEDVRDPTVADVFGTYHGTGASGAMMIGGSGRRMRNGRGASFREDHFVFGISLFAGYEWIVLREGGNDVYEESSGCGGGTTGTPDSVDTGTPPPTPTTPTPPTPTTTPTTGTTGTTGTSGTSDGDDGGSSCDCESDGCACAHGSLVPVSGVWAGVLLRRRRRRR